MTHQNGDRMLVLGAQDSEVRILSLRRFQLGFRLSHRFIGSEAGAILALGQVQGFLVGDYSGIEELLERVLCAKLVIVHGEFGLFTQAHIFHVGGTGLRREHICPHSVPNTAPQVRLPGRINGSE